MHRTTNSKAMAVLKSPTAGCDDSNIQNQRNISHPTVASVPVLGRVFEMWVSYGSAYLVHGLLQSRYSGPLFNFTVKGAQGLYFVAWGRWAQDSKLRPVEGLTLGFQALWGFRVCRVWGCSCFRWSTLFGQPAAHDHLLFVTNCCGFRV